MPDPPDYDGAWKNALDAYFQGFMALFWPDLHALIDWSHGPVFLDKELQRLGNSAKHGRLIVDKLARVRLLSGRDALALIHTEIQGAMHEDFRVRMFHYHIRLREKHPQYPLCSLAVLSGREFGGLHTRQHSAHNGSCTESYTYQHWGCSLTFSFPAIYLESWRPHVPQLLAQAPRNPFAVVVLAQLEANARHPGPQRLLRKTELARRLYQWKFSREQVLQLFNIMDAMLVLPEALELEFADAITQIEEEHQVTYINSVQRVTIKRERQQALQQGMQQGMQQGQRKGAAEIVTSLITRKFGPLPNWAQVRMARADEAELNQWAMQVLDAQRIEQVFE